MVAAGLDRAEVVKLLMSRGADWKTASSIADLRRWRRSWTMAPGVRSSRRPPQRVMWPASPAIATTRLIGTQGGLTALHFAVRQGSAAAARALVEAGADVNLVSPGDQASPLLVAVINGHFDLAAYLIDKGANTNLLSDAGVSPLYAVLNVQWAPIAAYPQPRSHLQQSRDYLDVMKLLLDKGADPNARVRRKVWYSGYNFDQSGVDEAGATPFWRAAYAADVAAMKLLVSYGGDPALPTMKLFSRRGPEDPVAGADKSGLPPTIIGGPHATPLHAAAGPGYAMGFAGNSHHVAPGGMLPAVKYLVEELGADVNAVDGDGNSIVHNAASPAAATGAVSSRRRRREDQSIGATIDGERTSAAHSAGIETIKLLESWRRTITSACRASYFLITTVAGAERVNSISVSVGITAAAPRVAMLVPTPAAAPAPAPMAAPLPPPIMPPTIAPAPVAMPVRTASFFLVLFASVT